MEYLFPCFRFQSLGYPSMYIESALPIKARRGCQNPGTRAADNCELSRGLQEQNLGPRREWQCSLLLSNCYIFLKWLIMRRFFISMTFYCYMLDFWCNQIWFTQITHSPCPLTNSILLLQSFYFCNNMTTNDIFLNCKSVPGTVTQTPRTYSNSVVHFPISANLILKPLGGSHFRVG